MKNPLWTKVILLLAALFCMSVLAFFISHKNTLDVYAQEEASEENAKDAAWKSSEGTVSGNENQMPKCICQEQCTQYAFDKECVVCKENFSHCTYISPNIKITIHKPSGWHNNTTKVHISVEDLAKSDKFMIQTIEAKIGQNGSWIDITEDKYVEISENSTVYVLVTDQKGKTYEKNHYIKCFDFTKPTLNAAISDGLLSIQAHDTDSGIEAIYVNGYEFTEVDNGVLNIRLQQFDSGYQYFTIQAMDCAGNMSEVYKTANPYYTDPEKENSNEDDVTKQLPVSASATAPSSATAQVMEHTKTDENGNMILESSLAESEKEENDKEKGKEFYTIQTASEKVFYLVIDRDGDEEMVYFLTEINENDLLNVTADNSELLPKNSAALESAIPVTESALSNNNIENELPEERTETELENNEDNQEKIKEPELKNSEENPIVMYLILGVISVAVIGGRYYFKVVREKKEDFLDEDDEEEDEEYEEDEEPETNSDDDFFEKEGEEAE